MWMKKTILIVLFLSLAGSMTSFADIVYEDDYQGSTVGDGFPAWNWGDNGTVHNAVYANYDGNIVVEHTGTIGNSTTAARSMRFGSKWDITLSGNTSSNPADYFIAFDIRSVSGNWDPINLEFFVLTKESGGDYGYGSGVSQYAQADGWIRVVANLADLTVNWWQGQDWDMTNPSWSIEVGGPPWPGTSIPAGTPAWDQIWLMDNLIITMGEEPPSHATELATDPVPDDEATDVFREPSLSWTPGEFADTHNVYLGTNFNDVNDADASSLLLVGPAQDANYYDPGRLEFGQTYYWRVDEVNAPPDNTVFKGDIWSFTVEPVSYPIPAANIIPTASGQSEGQGPEKTIDGSGLDENDLHSIDQEDMWLSSSGDPGSAWIQYEFDKPYKLHEMLIWNYNGDSILSLYGIKELTIEYSADNITWMQANFSELAQASGDAGYAANTTVPFDGAEAKYVKVTANNNFAGGDSFFNQYGLSEVRFMYIPVSARMPNPESGATEVAIDTVLSWRPGREAAEHKVYLSTDQLAVLNGTAPVVTVGQASYGPLSLNLGSDYYWRVDEVNNAEATPIWQGDTWSFSTTAYLVVDDFESYNDIPTGEEGSNLVYETWTDGYDNPSVNGSTMGYATGASMETDIVHGGNQSAPLSYNNTSASLSEVTVDPGELAVGSNWTIGAPEILVLWFYGDPNNAGTEQLYVKLNNSKLLVSGIDLTQAAWQNAEISLADFGINLANVTQLVIGLERTGATGSEGILFMDDIWLYKSAEL